MFNLNLGTVRQACLYLGQLQQFNRIETFGHYAARQLPV
jgi:hypothetical protein